MASDDAAAARTQEDVGVLRLYDCSSGHRHSPGYSTDAISLCEPWADYLSDDIPLHAPCITQEFQQGCFLRYTDTASSIRDPWPPGMSQPLNELGFGSETYDYATWNNAGSYHAFAHLPHFRDSSFSHSDSIPSPTSSDIPGVAGSSYLGDPYMTEPSNGPCFGEMYAWNHAGVLAHFQQLRGSSSPTTTSAPIAFSIPLLYTTPSPIYSSFLDNSTSPLFVPSRTSFDIPEVAGPPCFGDPSTEAFPLHPVVSQSSPPDHAVPLFPVSRATSRQSGSLHPQFTPETTQHNEDNHCTSGFPSNPTIDGTHTHVPMPGTAQDYTVPAEQGYQSPQSAPTNENSSTRRIKCTVAGCSIDLKNTRTLNGHLRDCHGIPKRIERKQCPDCERSYKRSNDLMKHINENHNNHESVGFTKVG
ncbi:hypothetical protein C8Q80DRAFT_218972 [Daedaleopsis nitida]|nr:hypothetical protein C8Q80DRAFT_218972 [Daedaleopsis nitida]